MAGLVHPPTPSKTPSAPLAGPKFNHDRESLALSIGVACRYPRTQAFKNDSGSESSEFADADYLPPLDTESINFNVKSCHLDGRSDNYRLVDGIKEIGRRTTTLLQADHLDTRR